MKKIEREIIIDKHRFKTLSTVDLILVGPGSGNLKATEKIHIPVSEGPNKDRLKVKIEIEPVK